MPGRPLEQRLDHPSGHPLDDVVGSSLTGAHAHLAQTYGRAMRYPPDVSPFAALAAPDPQDWHDHAVLAGPGGLVGLAGERYRPPPGWSVLLDIEGVQLDGTGLAVRPDPDAVALGPADVPEMLDLIARTEPGPFLPRTVELGGYLGFRRNGVLVAMAGERLRPSGWCEISAVCTDPAERGRGLAGRLVRAVGAAIRERGEVPFLHVGADNHAAIRLYCNLGFTIRRTVVFGVFGAPAAVPPYDGADRDGSDRDGTDGGSATEAGDAACWADRLCPECGAMPDPAPAGGPVRCWRCGAVRGAPPTR